ncbi:Ubiquitin-conjugating enzyme E2 1 [Orchesella cincta]|uniref:Ubiquitin-conjugating enzyme E2 1 n=1 Tax=Orchesella cincta TaxID=48709 RepID=A0A1D2NJM5_ORCCI|nr:Ubiquitin-conjugating enzyme E2 1 [Orchesella cincta]
MMGTEEALEGQVIENGMAIEDAATPASRKKLLREYVRGEEESCDSMRGIPQQLEMKKQTTTIFGPDAVLWDMWILCLVLVNINLWIADAFGRDELVNQGFGYCQPG